MCIRDSTKTIDTLLAAGANGNLIASPAIGDDMPAHLRGFVKSPSFTALNLAAQLGAVHSIATLVAGGASPNLENKQGYTPLQLALENNQVDAVETLLKGKGGGWRYSLLFYSPLVSYLLFSSVLILSRARHRMMSTYSSVSTRVAT